MPRFHGLIARRVRRAQPRGASLRHLRPPARSLRQPGHAHRIRLSRLSAMEQLDDTRPALERTAPQPSVPEFVAASTSRWGIAVLLFLAMTLNYFDRQMIAFLKPLLSHELRWSEADYANIITAFQAAYAASYLLLGRFVDRFGAKAGFALAFAVWSVAQIAHGFARSISQFIAARMLLGAGEGGA